MSNRKPTRPAPAPDLQDLPPVDEAGAVAAPLVPRLGAGAVSWHDNNPHAESLALRCALDPGCPPQARDGWRGRVAHWGVGYWACAGEGKDGNKVAVISLLLIDVAGHSCRLTGWPAINSWAALLSALSPARAGEPVPVLVTRHASGTPGRSYWQVQPDYEALGCAGGRCGD